MPLSSLHDMCMPVVWRVTLLVFAHDDCEKPASPQDYLTLPKRQALDSSALGWQQEGRRIGRRAQACTAGWTAGSEAPSPAHLHLQGLRKDCTAQHSRNHGAGHADGITVMVHDALQDFNFFLDQQPVSASASSRLLAEPEKRKRGLQWARLSALCWLSLRFKYHCQTVQAMPNKVHSHLLLCRAAQESDALARG